MKKLFAFCWLLFLPVIAGCSLAGIGIVGGAAGAAIQGYIMWKQGEATKYYFADEQVLYRAVEKSAKDLELPIKKNELDKEGYHISVGEKDKFKIKIEKAEKNISKVCIRINFMGDKPYAELFYKQIDENLNIIEFENGTPKKKTPPPQNEEQKRRRLLKNRR